MIETDADLLQLCRLIEEAESQAEALRPAVFSAAEASGTTAPRSVRQWYWAARAIETFVDDPYLTPRGKSLDAIRSSVRAASVHVSSTVLSKNPGGVTSDLVLASSLHLASCMGRITQTLEVKPPGNTLVLLTERRAALTDEARRRLSCRAKNLASTSDYYETYLLWEALNAAGVTIGKRYVRLYREAWERLRAEFVRYAGATPLVDPVAMCVACNLVAHGTTRGALPRHDEREIVGLIRLVINTAWSASRSEVAFRRRAVSELSSGAWIHSFPWEELLVLSGAPDAFLPQALDIVERVLSDLDSRALEYGGLRWLHYEGAASRELEVCPYFTCYATTLLLQSLRVMRNHLSERLAAWIQEFDGRGVSEPTDAFDLTREEVFDTEEGAFAHLGRLLAEPGSVVETVRRRNTVLLFGPPGTGKTTLLGSLAKTLKALQVDRVWGHHKWPLIVLNPKVFLVADTFSTMLDNFQRVLTLVSHLPPSVVLFDEAEELVRARRDAGERFGRMFTASTLPLLTRLQKLPCLYVFATNFVGEMDSAAIRKGRFAVRKGVGWVGKEGVERFVERHFGKASSEVQGALQDLFKERPIKELFDIVKHLGPSPSLSHVESLKSSWKAYLHPDDVKEHRENIAEYDDTFKGA